MAIFVFHCKLYLVVESICVNIVNISVTAKVGCTFYTRYSEVYCCYIEFYILKMRDCCMNIECNFFLTKHL